MSYQDKSDQLDVFLSKIGRMAENTDKLRKFIGIIPEETNTQFEKAVDRLFKFNNQTIEEILK